MEHSFSIDVEGSETKQKWTGKFTYKRPNLRIKSDISKMTARLNEDLKNLDDDMQFLHRVISNLRFTLTTSPEWWKEADFGFELYDTNVIFDIYREVQKFEDDYFEKLWGDQDKVKSEKKSEKKKDAKSET